MGTFSSGAGGLGGAGSSGSSEGMISVTVEAKDAEGLKKAIGELKKLVSGGKEDDNGEEPGKMPR